MDEKRSTQKPNWLLEWPVGDKICVEAARASSWTFATFSRRWSWMSQNYRWDSLNLARTHDFKSSSNRALESPSARRLNFSTQESIRPVMAKKKERQIALFFKEMPRKYFQSWNNTVGSNMLRWMMRITHRNILTRESCKLRFQFY